jgi:hypothetical protein
MTMMLVYEDGKVIWAGGPAVPFDDRVTKPTLH